MSLYTGTGKPLKPAEELADKVYRTFMTRDPREITTKLGIKVEGEEGGDLGGLQIFGKYDHRSRTITIYRDLLLSLSKQFTEPIKYLIAHELFHYYAKKEKIEGANEISAHRFACRLLDIRPTPKFS